MTTPPAGSGPFIAPHGATIFPVDALILPLDCQRCTAMLGE